MPCSSPCRICLPKEYKVRVSVLGRPLSAVVRDALELYLRLHERGMIYTVLAMLESPQVPISSAAVVNINIDKIVNNIAERVESIVAQHVDNRRRRVDISMYAADIDTLRGVARQILSDVSSRVDLKTAILQRMEILQRIARRLERLRGVPDAEPHLEVLDALLGVIVGRRDYATALALLKEYARN